MVLARSGCGVNDQACQTLQGWVLLVGLTAVAVLFAFFRWKMRRGSDKSPSVMNAVVRRESSHWEDARQPASGPARRLDLRQALARIVGGIAGLAVWIVGILKLGSGHEVSGTLEVILGGIMMSLALWQRVPNFLGSLWHLLSR